MPEIARGDPDRSVGRDSRDVRTSSGSVPASLRSGFAPPSASPTRSLGVATLPRWPAASRASQIRALQRTAGNAAVGQIIARDIGDATMARSGANRVREYLRTAPVPGIDELYGELRRVRTNLGMDHGDALVATGLVRLPTGEEVRVEGGARALDELLRDVRRGMVSRPPAPAQGTARVTNAPVPHEASREEFLSFFARTARRRALDTLARARQTALRERARYGLAGWTPPAVATPTSGTVQPATEWSMGANADTARLAANARLLLESQTQLRAARAELGELVGRRHLAQLLPPTGAIALRPEPPTTGPFAPVPASGPFDPRGPGAPIRLVNRRSIEDMSALVGAMEQEWDAAVDRVTVDTPVLGPIARRSDPRAELQTIADGSSRDAAGLLGPAIDRLIASADTVTRTLDEDRVWRLPRLVERTEAELGLRTGSQEYAWVEAERGRREEDRQFWELLEGGLIVAAAILAIPTGGTATGALLAGAAAVGGLHQGVQAVEEHIRADAEANATFSRAEALSAEEPSLFWLAVTIIGVIADVSGALAAFRELRTAVAAVRAAPPGGRLTELTRLRARADAVHPGLGARVESDARRRFVPEDTRAASALDPFPDPPAGGWPPPGTMPTLPPQPRNFDRAFRGRNPLPVGTWVEAPNEREALRWFRGWTRRDPDREVEMFLHEPSQRWFVVQGDYSRNSRRQCVVDLGVDPHDMHSIDHYHNPLDRVRSEIPAHVPDEVVEGPLVALPSMPDFLIWAESSRRLGRPYRARVRYRLPDGALGSTEILADYRAWQARAENAFQYCVMRGPLAGRRGAFAAPEGIAQLAWEIRQASRPR